MENKMVRVPFDLELARKIDNKEIDGKIILSSGRKDLESSCSIAAIFEDIDYRIALNYNLVMESIKFDVMIKAIFYWIQVQKA